MESFESLTQRRTDADSEHENTDYNSHIQQSLLKHDNLSDYAESTLKNTCSTQTSNGPANNKHIRTVCRRAEK